MAKTPLVKELDQIVGILWDDRFDPPILVATEDFFEYLEEQGYEDTIEGAEFIEEVRNYIRTECEKI